MSEEKSAKNGVEHGTAQHHAKPAESKAPTSVDIFAPPNETVTFEEISSGWSRPIRASIEKTITAPAQPQLAEPPPATTQRKKIPTW